MTEVGDVGSTAHVGIYALYINDPNGSCVVLWQPSTSHLICTNTYCVIHLTQGNRSLFTTSKCNICTFSTAGSSIERSWTMTGMWALIFSFTHSSSSWSWPGFTQGVSSSMVLLWRPSSLIKTQKICKPTKLTGYMEKNICSGKVPRCGLVSKHCVCQSCNQMLT